MLESTYVLQYGHFGFIAFSSFKLKFLLVNLSTFCIRHNVQHPSHVCWCRQGKRITDFLWSQHIMHLTSSALTLSTLFIMRLIQSIKFITVFPLLVTREKFATFDSRPVISYVRFVDMCSLPMMTIHLMLYKQKKVSIANFFQKNIYTP